MSITPWMRQMLVFGGCQLAGLSTGSVMGYPMVLLLQLREDDSTIKLNLDTATWIGSVHGIAGVLSIFISLLMQWKGRKTAFMVSCIVIIIGWVIVYCATSITAILISEIFHGCGLNALSTVSYLTITEMTPPNYRNISVQTFTVLTSLGVSISGMMSRFFDWRTICLVLCVPSIIALCLSLLWPESPPWLACQGRFHECEEAFKQLRLMDDSSKKELEVLIAAQKQKIFSEKKNHKSLQVFWNKLKRRDFYLPTIHIFILLTLTYWSGCAVFIITSLELMQKTTNNDRAIFVSGISLNVACFVAMCTSNLICRRVKNKTIVLWSTAGAVTCLIGLILVNGLQNVDIISKESWAGLVFINAYVVSVGLGMLTVVFIITSEIMPVKHRGIGGVMYILFNSILYSSSLKISPYLFVYLNLWGTLLIFALNALICSMLVWRFVPETKNRTLQEIEDFYTHGKFVENHFESDKDAELFIAG